MILKRLSEKYRNKKIFMTGSDTTGCNHYRIHLPYLFLKDSFDCIEDNAGFPAQNPKIYESDVIWLQRPNHEFFTTYIPDMQSKGKKVIIDLDDTLFHIPASNLAHRHYPKKELDKVDAVFKLADCLTASTKPLAEVLENRYNKKVFIIPNHIAKSEFIINDVKPKNDKIKIGWAGSYTHNGDFDNHLVKVLRGLPKDKVDFYSMGFTPAFFKDFAISLPWVETLNFTKEFSAHNWDIGIMVAQDNTFNKCKSNLKYLEYGITRTAVVGHAVYPYINTIEHGVDGLLVKKEKTDWKEHIYRLIEDEPFRLQMANNAFDKVNKEYSYDEDSDRLEQIYLDIFDYLYEGRVN